MKVVIVTLAATLAACGAYHEGSGDNAPEDQEVAPPDGSSSELAPGALDWRIPVGCRTLPWLCPDAGAPDARPDARDSVADDYYYALREQCRSICLRFEEVEAALPDQYWCAPPYGHCYVPCVSDGDHVPEACWWEYWSWLRDERDEGPDACSSPYTRDPPYARWAEYYRQSYRTCWDRLVTETR